MHEYYQHKVWEKKIEVTRFECDTTYDLNLNIDFPNRYEAFDFHAECSKMRWHRLSTLIDRLAHEQDDFSYFMLTKDGTIKSQQDGVFRTNCIDCLDRTNVVQSMLARRSLTIVLQVKSQVVYNTQGRCVPRKPVKNQENLPPGKVIGKSDFFFLRENVFFAKIADLTMVFHSSIFHVIFSIKLSDAYCNNRLIIASYTEI